MPKVRDSYRVRQVGHQLQQAEVRTIWLFETTPGVCRSKFPVLQHRRRVASKKQPSRVNLSHEGSHFSFPFLVLSCGKKKPLEESDTPLLPARCHQWGSQGSIADPLLES